MDEKLDHEGQSLDLFGNPVLPIRDPRGRPAYAKNKENQMVVLSLKAAGWVQKDIASYLACDEKTLRKHFSRELEHGALIVDGMAMQVLVKKMMEGHVGATKEVRKITDLRQPQPKKPKSELLGKKEQLSRAACEVPDDWGGLLRRPDQVN